MEGVHKKMTEELTSVSINSGKIFDEVKATQQLIKKDLLEEIRNDMELRLPAVLTTISSQIEAFSEAVTDAASIPTVQLHEQITAMRDQMKSCDRNKVQTRATYATVTASKEASRRSCTQ